MSELNNVKVGDIIPDSDNIKIQRIIMRDGKGILIYDGKVRKIIDIPKSSNNKYKAELNDGCMGTISTTVCADSLETLAHYIHDMTYYIHGYGEYIYNVYELKKGKYKHTDEIISSCTFDPNLHDKDFLDSDEEYDDYVNGNDVIGSYLDSLK